MSSIGVVMALTGILMGSHGWNQWNPCRQTLKGAPITVALTWRFRVPVTKV